MSYTKTTWRNNQAPAINADNLNHMEQGIESAHNQIGVNTSNIESLTTQVQNNATNIASEISARQTTDSSLQSQIDQLVAPTGEAPTPAEIENARIGDDGVTYDTLGNAIRGQFSDVKSEINQLCSDTDIDVTVGKNLFNKNIVVMDYSLNASNGGLISETGKATSDFIPIEGGADYYFGKNGVNVATSLACFYDSGKSFISYQQYFGEPSHSSTPNNASYVRITFNYSTVPISQAQLNKTAIQPYDRYGNTYIDHFTDESTTEKILDDLGVELIASTNLFDKSTVTMDYALNASNGGLVSESGKATSDFIPVTLGKKYYFAKNGTQADTNLSCLYSASKSFLGYVQYWGHGNVIEKIGGVVPAYVRCTFNYSNIPIAQAQLNEGMVKPYAEYGATYEQGTSTLKEVYIASSGADYSSIRTAFETEGENCHYKIASGYYDVASDFTDDEINNASYDSSHNAWCGIVVPSGSIVEGIGNVVIDCVLSSDYSYNKRMQIATLNLIGSCELRNLTVKASGNRVPIHDDFVGASGKTHKSVNCKFVQTMVDSSTSHAYAVGLRNGLNIDIDGCEFDPGFSEHDSNGLTSVATINITNSHCTNWLKFDGYASGLPHSINLKNVDYSQFSLVQRNLIVQNYSHSDGTIKLDEIDYDNYDSFDIVKIPVSSGIVVNDIVTIDGAKATAWDNTVLGVVIGSRDSYGYAKVMKFDKAIYTPILGIASCAENDKVALTGGRLIVDSNGTSGVIKLVSDGKGFVYFY